MFRALAVAFLLVAVGLAIIARSALKQIVQREKQVWKSMHCVPL